MTGDYDANILDLAARLDRLEAESAPPDEQIALADRIVALPARSPAEMAAQLKVIWEIETATPLHRADSPEGKAMLAIVTALSDLLLKPDSPRRGRSAVVAKLDLLLELQRQTQSRLERIEAAQNQALAYSDAAQSEINNRLREVNGALQGLTGRVTEQSGILQVAIASRIRRKPAA